MNLKRGDWDMKCRLVALLVCALALLCAAASAEVAAPAIVLGAGSVAPGIRCGSVMTIKQATQSYQLAGGCCGTTATAGKRC